MFTLNTESLYRVPGYDNFHSDENSENLFHFTKYVSPILEYLSDIMPPLACKNTTDNLWCSKLHYISIFSYSVFIINFQVNLTTLELRRKCSSLSFDLFRSILVF